MEDKTILHYVHRVFKPEETKARYGKNNYTYVVSSSIKPFNCSSHDLNHIIQLYYDCATDEYEKQAEIYGIQIKEYPCDIFDPEIQRLYKMSAIKIDDMGNFVKPTETNKLPDIPKYDDIYSNETGYEADSENPPKLPTIPESDGIYFTDSGNETDCENPPKLPAGSVNLSSYKLPNIPDTDTWDIPKFEDPDDILKSMKLQEHTDLINRGGSKYYGARIIKCNYPPYRTKVEFENYGLYHTVVPDSHIVTRWKPYGRTKNEENVMEQLIARDYIYHKKKYPNVKDELNSILDQINKMMDYYNNKEESECECFGMKQLFETSDSDDNKYSIPRYNMFDKDEDEEWASLYD
jgi:hypothetical protein